MPALNTPAAARPVPYALTPLALTALASLEDIPAGQWACRACGSAWHGTPPGDGLCPACRPPDPPAPVPARRPRPRGPRSPWVLAEDGITDEIAVELAVTGARRVALTPGERIAAAAAILARGGTPYLISKRLRCSSETGHALAAAARARPAARNAA
jgi:hypothetical protein